MPEITRNPVPPDISFHSSPTPAIDSQIPTVMRDSMNAYFHILNLAFKPQSSKLKMPDLVTSNPLEMYCKKKQRYLQS